MAEAKNAKVTTRLIFEDRKIAPQKSKTYKWRIDGTNVWWFHVVPRDTQTSYPQFIKIDEVQISAERETPTAATRFFANIRVVNLTPAKGPDFPHEDVCHFDVYVAVASPV